MMAEDVWRTEAAKQFVRSPQSNRDLKQIVFHSILQVAFSILMMCLLTAASVWADYQAGVDAYERGDYKTALQELHPLAEGGNPKAQFHLGRMYARGNGVPQDDEGAVKWFRKAAEQGDADAQFLLGLTYEIEGSPIKDYKEAVKWFRKAAEQGNADAHYYLGRSYYDGKGVVQDYKEAVKWYQKAAEQNHVGAQSGLGWMYYKGEGVPQDYVTAHVWYNLAGAGNETVRELRDSIAKNMTPVQIAEAQRLAREWKPKKDD